MNPALTELERTNLEELVKIIDESDWHQANTIEPNIGEHSCPAEAEEHGIGGQSLYTAFIKNTDDDGYECKFELCSSSPTGTFYTRNLEEAIRHMRHHHFNHSPFVCIPTNGDQWYVPHPSCPLRHPVLGWRLTRPCI
jgi:hypothetical protein